MQEQNITLTQLKILSFLQQERSGEDIANKLFVSIDTARNYVLLLRTRGFIQSRKAVVPKSHGYGNGSLHSLTNQGREALNSDYWKFVVNSLEEKCLQPK